MRLKYTNRLLYLEERIRFYTKETHSLVIKGQNGAARILARDLCRLDILCKQTKEFLLKFDSLTTLSADLPYVIDNQSRTL